ncbi:MULTISPECIES: glycosyltransferase [unclassified Aeromonas]|uniref:glycosyltransferase n=1 Tax=Aeromonas TaxID=642 RepID=UPI0034A0F869
MDSRNNYSIAVLLAAYNGEKWLTEQIDSILVQKQVDIHIYISLDHSNDDSLELCVFYASKYDNITLLPYGERFGGAGQNFFRLVMDVDFNRYDFIAFSDQDDIWHADKLIGAVRKLDRYDCYSSNVIAFWDDDRELLIDKAQSQRKWDFLFEAAGPGCTYVFKRDLAIVFQRWLIKNHDEVVSKVSLHDWLLYAFARYHGYRWIIDSEPSMRYRQHANNQVGTNSNWLAAKKRLQLIKSHWYREQVVNIAGLLELHDIAIIKYGLSGNYLGNLYLLTKINELRRRGRDRLALAIALLFNLF